VRHERGFSAVGEGFKYRCAVERTMQRTVENLEGRLKVRVAVPIT
jgi:hypothetical protein